MFHSNYNPRTMTETKRNHYRVRNTPEWKTLRTRLIDFQKGLCPISGRALGRQAAVHHMDLDDAHYGDLDDISKFICVTSTIHDALHTLYKCPVGWKKALENLAIVMQRMDELNGLEAGKKPPKSK